MIELAIAHALHTGASQAVASIGPTLIKQGVSDGVKAVYQGLRKKDEQRTLLELHPPLRLALLALNLSADQSNAIEAFFKSETFDGLVRSYATIAAQSNTGSVAALPLMTRYLTALLPDTPEALITDFSSELLASIDQSTSLAFDAAVATGLFPSQWKIQSAIVQLVNEEVAGQLQQLEQLTAMSAKTLSEVDALAVRYRREVGRHNSKIRPQTLQEESDAPISELYIEPSILAETPDAPQMHLGRRGALQRSFRSVLLGNPGAGKSTFANKVCYDLCTNYDDGLVMGRKLTPIPIVLRDYARFKSSQPCSFIEYARIYAKTEFQLDLPESFFPLLLLTGRALVIFDGLDELIDTSERVAIRDAVEHFISVYPACPALVTSRQVGYEQARLDKTRFNILRLAPFDIAQVTEYAGKWFMLARQGTKDDKSKLANAFIQESSVVPDIRSNPLMLGLLCNLYRQDGYLPKNRPDVYARCAELLFTKWDRGRNITVPLPMDHKLRPAMGHLAYWIYSDEKLQAGVPEERLVHETTNYLRQWFEDEEEAISVASQFVSFFKGRAWVFSDTGSDRNSPLYQFTHRTFLEFFTAENLVKSYPGAAKLHEHLLPKIVSREWDVVSQLAYQMNAKSTDSHDLLVLALLDSAKEEELAQRLTILSFLFRIVDLLYPTPPIRRRAVSFAIETFVKNGYEISTDVNMKNLASEIALALAQTPEESVKITGTEMRTTYVREITSEHLSVANRAATILMIEEISLLPRAADGTIKGADIALWEDIEEKTVDDIKDVRLAISRTDSAVATCSWMLQEISVTEIIKIFGPDAIFRSFSYPFANWIQMSIGDVLIEGAFRTINPFRSSPDFGSKWIPNEANEIRNLLLSGLKFPTPTESIDVRGILGATDDETWRDGSIEAEAALLLLAVSVELRELPSLDISGEPTDFQRGLLAFMNVRSTPDEEMAIARSFVEKSCGTQETKDLLTKWIENVFSFKSEDFSEPQLLTQL